MCQRLVSLKVQSVLIWAEEILLLPVMGIHGIVNKAKSENAAIAIEDLTGIRERTNQQPRKKPNEGVLIVGLPISCVNSLSTKLLKQGLA